ncbi:MAG: hypothetical protein K8I29_18640 [Alphaproteobacteria bacterium]|uniref:Uncharacterized protein n=1 Tax=Candidatus Nitrobium versatile TaxID=2884831 RepID=A0A953SI34_9BACT|nr:hypothetical protein [Candidatus Nitrobium versatile]
MSHTGIGGLYAGRTYFIFKTIVFVITVLTGLSAVYYGYMAMSSRIPGEWGEYCSRYTDPVEHANCMMLSRKLVDEFTKLLYVNLAVAVVIPGIFSIGDWFYRTRKGTKPK